MSNGWRTKPFTQAIAHICWGSMLFTSSVPVFAAPPPAILPQGLQSTGATATVVGNAMTVNQSANRAILNWDSFNIGSDARVQFVQPSANATALNRIFDTAPSQIFGQLQANGNVYLINPNGIVFGSTAQVNVHGLLAATSTLNLNDKLYQNSSLQQAINTGDAALSGLGDIKDGTGKSIARIEIQKGANIATDAQGSVLVFAPEIVNNGTISTPDGQSVLAASKNKVYIASTGASEDLRGLLVEVDTGGDVSNIGEIVAERGNISMVGLAVNQQGRLRATTSVDVNGSIRLLARDGAAPVTLGAITLPQRDSLLVDNSSKITSANNFVPVSTRTGTVTLGAGSVTEVTADTSGKTAVDAQTQAHSKITLLGKTIVLGDGSVLTAKSGDINLIATARPNDPYSTNATAKDGSRIYVGANARIDVSGENVELPVERRVVDVELRGDELKDAPLQRDGILRGKTVTVDIDKGSPLISDLSPTLAKIQKGVKERMVSGGSIGLVSAGDVVMSNGATLDVSGGSISYAAGLVNTTKLLANGRIIDIGSADPNLVYTGIFGEHTVTHPKWGATIFGQNSLFAQGTYQSALTKGADGGDLSITAPMLYGFDLATINAGVVSGATQRTKATAPVGSSIAISLGGAVLNDAIQNTLISQAAHSTTLAVGDSLIVNGAQRDLNISADKLNASGFGSFSLSANGAVQLQQGTSLQLQPLAKFTLNGTSLQVNGSIRAAGGELTLNAKPPIGAPTQFGNFALTVGSGALLDVSGDWVNDLLAIAKGQVPDGVVAVDGGTISASARGDVLITEGAQLKANGGGRIKGNGAFVGGDGGSIALKTNALSANEDGSRLQFGGALSAYGFGNGGKLSLQANAFQIGGDSTANANTVILNPTFFASGGFSSYALTANRDGIDVLAGQTLRLHQQNLQLKNIQTASRADSHSDVGTLTDIVDLPDYFRKKTDLSLTLAQSVLQSFHPGYLRVGTGAQILGEPGASIALTSDNSLFVDGTLSAPGGSLKLTVKTVSSRPSDPTQSLWLGSSAQLLAPAARVKIENPRNLLLGTVWDAGSIVLDAERGAIIAAPGSIIDVSGAQFTHDYLVGTSESLSGFARRQVNAAGGSIAVTAAEGIALYSDLLGTAAGPDGRGGSLSIALNANRRGDPSDSDGSATTFSYTPLEVQLLQQMPTWQNWQVGQSLPVALAHKAWVAADTIDAGGFSSLALEARNLSKANIFSSAGSITFSSDVSLSLADALALNSTNLNLNNHHVDLTASSIKLGQSSNDPILQSSATATAGTGQLSLFGKFIELVGNLSLSNVAQTLLHSDGDVRLRSVIGQPSLTESRQLAAAELQTAGNLRVNAAQIYPTTLSDYTFRLTGANSVFATGKTGDRTPVLSAGGTLRVIAANIEQGGVLTAPLGQVLLGNAATTQSIHLLPGSIIDVSANNQIIPFGRLRGGDINWIYPIDYSQPILVDAPPEKRVDLVARSIAMDAGSTVSLSGGGDIYAFENVPGPGGSKDFLAAANASGAFAIIPSAKSPIAAYDVVEMADASSSHVGQIIHLDGGNGLPAGDYAVLPAHYALLPGAYLITPTNAALQPGISVQRSDGALIVSGRFGSPFSGQYDSKYNGFVVETGATARQRSEYNESTGAEFFADKQVDLAADAGRLTLQAQTDLTLNGMIAASSQQGRGAELDIVANQIDVVNQRSANYTGVQLEAAALSALNVDSLLLGGRRTRNGSDLDINVQSSRVTVRENANLTAPDVMLVARDAVNIEQGARIEAAGHSKTQPDSINVTGDGALLRVSSASQADVVRTAVNSVRGDLNIAAGSNLVAAQSVLMDSTRNFSSKATMALNGGSLNITSNRISLGDGIAVSNGVAFSNAELAAMNAGTLRLSSRGSVDFYGDVSMQNQRVELNAGSLRNMGGADAVIRVVDTLQLSNTANVGDSSTTATGGNLLLSAARIELGNIKDNGSTMRVHGFTEAQLGEAAVTRELIGNGAFTLFSDGNVNVVANRIAGTNGANTALVAAGAVDMRTAGVTVTNATVAGLGATLAVSGERIANGTRIELPSGKLMMTATGAAASDNVALSDGALVDVSGRTLEFAHATTRTDGGEVHLLSANGNITATSGATVRLGDASQGADAGLLAITASKGRVLWNAAIDAVTPSGNKGGSLTLDVGSLSDFGGWLQRIAGSSLNHKLDIRTRSGDINVDSALSGDAIALSADAGRITVGSTISANGESGGSIEIYAAGDVHLLSNASIQARALADGGRGGNVELGTKSGALIFDNGGAIDVAGNGGRNGQVKLRVPRSIGNDSVAIVNSGLAVAGAENIYLDAFKTYNSSTLDLTLLDQMYADAVNFMANETAIKSGLGAIAQQSNFHLRPELDVVSTGNLSVDTAVDFAADSNFDGSIDWRFGANTEAPVLTLRAAGNLDVQQSLLDGVAMLSNTSSLFAQTFGTPFVLLTGLSTDYRLVAGADLNAAGPGKTLAQGGNLTIANGADILTGAGNISLAAAGNIVVLDPNSAIGSFGKTRLASYVYPQLLTDNFGGLSGVDVLPDVGDADLSWAYWLFLSEFKYLQFPEQGGDVKVSARGNIEFAQTDGFFSDWIHRLAGGVNINLGVGGNNIFNVTTWGISATDFQQGIAAIGGGNLALQAGGDITNLNAAVPVTAKAVRGGNNRVEIVGGGNMSIQAGGNIWSPRILVDKGQADIVAGGAIGAKTSDVLNAVIALSDAQVNLHANKNVAIDAVINSTVMPLSEMQNPAPGQALINQNYFFTYSQNSALNTVSDTGDIHLANRTSVVMDTLDTHFALPETGYRQDRELKDIFALYPQTFTAVAATGSITLDNSLLLFPGASGNLSLLAGANIESASSASLVMSDTPLSLLPQTSSPVRHLDDGDNGASVLSLLTDSHRLLTAPIHVQDTASAIIDTLMGDITSLVITMPKQTLVYAGRDIRSVTFNLQHSRDNEISEIAAGRDILYPLEFFGDGKIKEAAAQHIDINGPGRLYMIAGRNINFGASAGVQSLGNSSNVVLADNGADISVLAGINGASALTDPVLYNAFADRYLGKPVSVQLQGSFIDWVSGGGFTGDIQSLVSVFTGKNYISRETALADFASLPVLTRQSVSLEAYRINNTRVSDYSSDLIDFVSFERFAGDLRGVVQQVTGTAYASNADAAAALALLPATQQQQIARSAFDGSAPITRREMLLSVMYSEVRQGGIENTSGLVVDPAQDGYARSNRVIAAMFPGDSWKGDVQLVFSKVYTIDDGDINFVAPGGKVDVGLAGSFAGFSKAAGDLGVVTQRYGEINAVTNGNININQSRIFSLDGAPITLWSSNGDIDAGRGAKTALSVPPPLAVTDPVTGAVTLEYPPALSGSGIQAAKNARKTTVDRGPLLVGNNAAFNSDTRTSRIRFSRSFGANANAYLSAPSGVINAGDAGIQVAGNLFLAAQKVLGADNINVGGISVGVPVTSSVSAGTLSLGDGSSGAMQSATNSMNEALRSASNSLAEAATAFVTVDIIGVGN